MHARSSSRTSQASAEMPSFAAASSIAVFSVSGKRSEMRAAMPSSGELKPNSSWLALLDIHERRLLPREPHLDVAGREPPRDLECDLREEVEEAKPRRATERLAEPLRRESNVLVAQLGGHREVCEERVDVSCQLHRDVIMTSLWQLSSVYLKSLLQSCQNGLNKGIELVERPGVHIREVRAGRLFRVREEAG